MYNHELPYEVAALVDAELRSGERTVWTGQPIPRRFARQAIPAVLFGIPWTAFAIFWMAAAAMGARNAAEDVEDGGIISLVSFFPLFGLPFVLIGFGMLSTPYWLRRKALRTVYVITDQRVLIIAGGAWRSITVRSFEPHRLGDLRRVQKPDGSGDLIFERRWTADSDGDKQSTDHGFLAIRDVKAVEELVRKLADIAPE